MDKMLQGIRVLDLSRGPNGGFCSQLLVDYGAEVIKVENPAQGDSTRYHEPLIAGVGAQFYMVNRNKKSITLNLKADEGKEIFRKLAAVSDVVIDQFRPGVMERLGLGYDTLKLINPGLVYCSLSGYGMTGPMRHMSGHDLNFQSMGGLLSLTRDQNNKPVIPAHIMAALAGGGLYGVLGIMLALYNREKTGLGQLCDISILDGIVSFMTQIIADYGGGTPPRPGDKVLNGRYACYNVYRCRDGKYLSLGAIEPNYWEEFCGLIGREEYSGCQYDEQARKDVIQGVQGIMAERSRDEWMEYFAGRNLPVTPVLEINEVAGHPQINARKMMSCLENFENTGRDVHLIGAPIKFADYPVEFEVDFPEMGRDNDSILAQLGYEMGEIEGFKTGGII